MKKNLCLFILLIAVSQLFCSCTKNLAETHTFYLNSITGNDSNDGKTPETAWKSLKRASLAEYTAGNKLLLCSGCTFSGKLELNAQGEAENPVIISSYTGENGVTTLPVIDAKGYVAAISILNSKHLKISNLRLTSDAGEPVDPDAATIRYGVYIEANKPGEYSGISLDGLEISGIFATENVDKDGQNPTSNMGYGIFVHMKTGEAKISNISITNNLIERTGHTGIRVFGHRDSNTYLDSLTIVNNHLEHIGGPGMVPGMCENVLVRGNVVNYSGSDIDSRMHNRGSGIWPWTCNNVLIEKNKFMNAWGKMDSYGCHIDYNCNDVVVQYNLSMNNSGGFVEILGNNRNCSYRYNVSINDGYREKGKNGVVHDGKLLWTSGYVGQNPRKGPFNSYIYNNTIFVKEEYDTRFSFAPTTNGLLIANNIFYILGKSVDVKDNEVKNPEGSVIQNVVFKNNLYQRTNVIPESVSIKDLETLFGDPQFKNPGGLNIEDYIPQNVEIIKNKGIKIPKIPGDDVGLKIGLDVEHDILGNKITGEPDLGAIEIIK